MARHHDAVFATLVMTDSYLPGAMVLAHSLRDRGAKRARLAALVLMDKLSLDTISELRTVYDDIVPVEQIINMHPANLYLMNRPDLISTFTKIELWKQTQYKRIVYLDADMVAVRAPNELLTLDTNFAAAPDVGWPDCFNSGMMVLNPNLSDYYALLALARRGISFDGADQGLLNMHFTDWERLSFVYNCTPNANYQYVPAYRYFQNSISMIHFIGAQKPWTQGRDYKSNSGVYSELLGRWWAVYDRHYKQPKSASYSQYNPPRSKVQDYVQGEQETHYQSYTGPSSQPSHSSAQSYHQPLPESHPTPGTHENAHARGSTSMERPFGNQPGFDERMSQNDHKPMPTQEQRRWSAPYAEWEPTRQPPPINSKPEAPNFPTQQYEFNESKALFEPPESYPEPPKDMWYDVPEKPRSEDTRPKTIFPWEERAPRPTRVFPKSRESTPPPGPRTQTATDSIAADFGAATAAAAAAFAHRSSTDQFGISSPLGSIPGPRSSISQTSSASQPAPPPRPPSPPRHIFPWEARAPKPTRVFPGVDVISPPVASPPHTTEGVSSISSGTNVQQAVGERRGSQPPDNPWEAFASQTNKWDENPEITRYMEQLNKPRRAPVQVLLNQQSQEDGKDGPPPATERRISLRLTDFPTEVERPSLPVTPAPIRRTGYFGNEQEERSVLPIAHGVPRQEEWVRRFTSHCLPAVPNAILRDIGGVLHLTCQHCGKQNPIIKLEELQNRQTKILTGEETISKAPTPPRRQMPDSQSAEQAIEAAVKAMSIVSRPKAPAKPILREPHFEILEEDDSEVATNEQIVVKSHTTATGSRSPIRFNPIVLEGEAVSEKGHPGDVSNIETELAEEDLSTAIHHFQQDKNVDEERISRLMNRSSFGEADASFEDRETMVSETRSAFDQDVKSAETRSSFEDRETKGSEMRSAFDRDIRSAEAGSLFEDRETIGSELRSTFDRDIRPVEAGSSSERQSFFGNNSASFGTSSMSMNRSSQSYSSSTFETTGSSTETHYSSSSNLPTSSGNNPGITFNSLVTQGDDILSPTSTV